ncbi:hypothetical protein ACTU6V_06380 [Microbacterium sp. A204]|uniref:hypothetical protein n=1 Tax=Microbacterium sp. A204 TaxID=3457321 RepID=UPI003FD080AE
MVYLLAAVNLVALGGLAELISNPLFGALSDHTFTGSYPPDISSPAIMRRTAPLQQRSTRVSP